MEAESRRRTIHAVTDGQKPLLNRQKRILLGSIDTVTGKLDTEKATRSLLTYRNTPVQGTGSSPAVVLFGQPMRDHLPQKRILREEWQEVRNAREQAHARRHVVKEKMTGTPSVADATSGTGRAGSEPIRKKAGKMAQHRHCHRSYATSTVSCGHGRESTGLNTESAILATH